MSRATVLCFFLRYLFIYFFLEFSDLASGETNKDFPFASPTFGVIRLAYRLGWESFLLCFRNLFSDAG